VGMIAALLRGARLDGCTAASPEKPLEIGTGPRSGRISVSAEKGSADIVDIRCMARTAGERSNATAFEIDGCGGVKVRAARTWAAGLESKLVKLIIDRKVTGRAKSFFMGELLWNGGSEVVG